ncbi:hypothetical protein OP10G_4317 [Fimbriimonas ginsengisoli Gsoil 348]|uniref:DUF4440 domain-containing protein n=2 Tax=Fimbriimonas ginsengisoli TaxID=1005039 RepID=A0A068NXZ0_FIMGI|nr:hypothetical protein OP10G_4317 [Fimbriimonas ginsengisoli Gsoil 348]
MVQKMVIALWCGLMSSVSFANVNKDEASVKAILGRLEKAWTSGDAKAWSEAFAKDADFTVWSGLRVHGREAIRAGHEGIFKGPYKGTVLKFEIDSLRWVRPDVAVVLTKGDTPGGKAGEQMKQTFVISKHGKSWLVDAFQNTRVQEWRGPTDRP